VQTFHVQANYSVCTRCLRGSEQSRTKRSKLRQAQRPHMVRLSGATGMELADIPGTSLKVSPVAIGLGRWVDVGRNRSNLFPPSVPRWVHWPDPLVTIEETAEAMHALFRQGKIRAIGVSNFSVSQTDRFRRVAPLHVLQPPYNLCRTYKRVSVFPSHLAGRGLARLERDES
jgi:hypothetical protein